MRGSALVHVAGGGQGRDRVARAVVAEARRRGRPAFVAGFAPTTPRLPRGRTGSFVVALAALAHYAAVRAWWSVRYRGRLVVVCGHWYDAVAGNVGDHDAVATVLRTSRLLWPLLPRADALVIVDDGAPGARPRAGEEWRPWMWHQLAPWLAPRVVATPADEGAAVGRRVLDALDAPPDPTYAWATAPLRRGDDARVTVGSSAAAAAAIHRPHRAHGTVAVVDRALLNRRWSLPHVSPVEGLGDLCRTLGVEPEALASFRTAGPQRLVIGAAAGGSLRLVLKMGPLDDAGLRREADVLRDGANGVNGVDVPALVWAGTWEDRFVVATEGVDRWRSPRSLRPDEVVETCLLLAGVRGNGAARPIVHGDLAPWNVVPAGGSGAERLVVVDWEHAREEDDPLHDLAHFVIQRAALLGAARPAAALAALTAPGSPGWRYLEARGADPQRADEHVARYIGRAFRPTPFHDEVLRLINA